MPGLSVFHIVSVGFDLDIARHANPNIFFDFVGRLSADRTLNG
jgi:hypothetical protein